MGYPVYNQSFESKFNWALSIVDIERDINWRKQ